ALAGRTHPQPTSLVEVASALEEVRQAKTAAAKQERLERLLDRLDPLAAKYVVKVLSFELRIGLQEGLVEAAIAQAFDVPLADVRLGREVILDGEVLAHRGDRVLPFFDLQRRLGRKEVSARLRDEVPLVFVAFDLLYLDGEVVMDRPLADRRRLMEEIGLEWPFLLARLETAEDPEHLDRIFAETRERGNEGLMVKDPLSPYTPGRRGLAWLKLKRPLATLDVVVTAVEWGHGKRKGVLSDYTFAVKDTQTGRLVNVGKAYTGLTDAEIAEFTRRFLEMTVGDHGHVRVVRAEVVLGVAFDSVQHSGRHLSGYALRFPRIVRIRDDKPVDEIDTVERVAELYERYFGEK